VCQGLWPLRSEENNLANTKARRQMRFRAKMTLSGHFGEFSGLEKVKKEKKVSKIFFVY
jgi:hypothetical protein